MAKSRPDPLYQVARYQPQWRDELVAFREEQGITSHERFLANLDNPEFGLALWLARLQTGDQTGDRTGPHAVAGYATSSPWQRRPDILGVNVTVSRRADPPEQVEVALALAGTVRREAQLHVRLAPEGPVREAPLREAPPGQAHGQAAPVVRIIVAFPVTPDWLPGFSEQDWEPLQELVQYRKVSRDLPPPPAPSPGDPPVEVRPFVAADLPAVLEVEHAAFPEFWWQSAGDFLRFGGAGSGSGGGGTAGSGGAGTGWTFDVMALGGKVIGYNMNTATPPRGYVGRIGVHPTHQGKGYGHRLLAHALLRLYEDGCEYVDLTTQIENSQSRRLYEKFGFEAVGGHWLVRSFV